MQDIAKEIVIKAQAGDTGSFRSIYEETAGFVYNVALRIVKRSQDAEEVAQEVFLNIYRNLKSFHFQSSFKTWAYRIAVNAALNHLKKMKREESRRGEFNEELNYNPVFSADKGLLSDKQEQEAQVNSLLDALNPEQRAVVVLRNLEGLSYQEIADTLEININTVRSRLKRARERLIALKGGQR
ncbi:MAG: RNA polymerase sigma factor [Candidatus Omnitrophica bacterium]|nr:RNA polymerase sigma factor [Candidatus Omnitrophota bacterium]MDD5652938.1 RNA polymerase sigma factor [Candidatus Omnitrophota bacterium]